jgi:hypothetical protein
LVTLSVCRLERQRLIKALKLLAIHAYLHFEWRPAPHGISKEYGATHE